jgi:hypothetical protein
LENKRGYALDHHLERALREKCGRLEADLASGAPNDYAGYRDFVGQIRGIQFAIALIIEFREQTGQDEDQDVL